MRMYLQCLCAFTFYTDYRLRMYYRLRHVMHSVTAGHLQNVRDCITHVAPGTEIKN